MRLTPTVISAQPLEKAISEYFEGNDRPGLEQFLSKQRAPDIADVVDRLPESERDEVFALLPLPLKSAVLAEVGEETKLVDATGLVIYMLIAKAILSELR